MNAVSAGLVVMLMAFPDASHAQESSSVDPGGRCRASLVRSLPIPHPDVTNNGPLTLKLDAFSEPASQGVQKIFDALCDTARAGNAEAQRRLALLYFDGIHVEKGKIDGLFWLHEAASRGDQPAVSALKQGPGTLRWKHDIDNAVAELVLIGPEGKIYPSDEAVNVSEATWLTVHRNQPVQAHLVVKNASVGEPAHVKSVDFAVFDPAMKLAQYYPATALTVEKQDCGLVASLDVHMSFDENDMVGRYFIVIRIKSDKGTVQELSQAVWLKD